MRKVIYRIILINAILLFSIESIITAPPLGKGDISWLKDGKYGVFMHYQYRILLGYSTGTQHLGIRPIFPDTSLMTAVGWNKYVDGFDVKKFANQMAKAKMGWVMFCLDDHYFAWPCSPNSKFNQYTGYGPGEKCSNRDLIMEVADALNAKGIKLIVYYAGLNGYMREPQVTDGLSDDGNSRTAPPIESRRKRLEILEEYADRFGSKIAGWWFDGMQPDSYSSAPFTWHTIDSVIHKYNPRAVIAFSYGQNEQACFAEGVDDFTGGDIWTGNKILEKKDFRYLTPQTTPPDGGILWHCKIYCGDIYHGHGTKNVFTDTQIISWIKTCNQEGGVCTLDWPFDPKTGLIKDFGFKQMVTIAKAIK